MLADGGSPEIRVRKGVKCIRGSAAERWREKRAIHARRCGAQQYLTAGEESPDNLETRVTGQGCCHGIHLLSGRERFGVEERRHVGRGEAGQLGRTRERVGGGIADSRHMPNILSEFRNIRQMPLLLGGPGSRN